MLYKGIEKSEMTNYRNMKILLIYIKEHILIYKVDSKRERI